MNPAWLLLPLGGVWIGYVAGAVVNPTQAPAPDGWPAESTDLNRGGLLAGAAILGAAATFGAYALQKWPPQPSKPRPSATWGRFAGFWLGLAATGAGVAAASLYQQSAALPLFIAALVSLSMGIILVNRSGALEG